MGEPERTARRGLLLINLGSPQAPTRGPVKTYLDEFLMDKYVIDLPAPLRFLLVRGVITPFRASKSAEAYAKIWRAEGSPLVHYTRTFAELLARELPSWDVRWAMRYGAPSIASQLKDWAVSDISVVPLYPQYAESSSRTAIDRVKQELNATPQPARILQDFFAEPEYIASEVKHIKEALSGFAADHLLLSFHGLPEHHMSKLHAERCFTPNCCNRVDAENRLCYRAQCFASARAIRAGLDYPESKFTVAFQSRLGRRPWIKPYTDLVATELAQNGVKRLLVACPSFVADCLETLEEIEMRLKEQFIADGGTDLKLVPALNDDPFWVKGFASMLTRPNLAWQQVHQR